MMNDWDRTTFLGDLENRITVLQTKLVKFVEDEDAAKVQETNFTIDCLSFLRFILMYFDAKINYPPEASDQMLPGILKAYGTTLLKE